MALEVLELTNEDPAFYPMMGPFLARRTIAKKVGGPIWDDDAKTWFVVNDHRAGVLGFCAVSQRGHRLFLESLWVSDGWDGLTVRLLHAAVERFGTRELHAVVRHDLSLDYQAVGFHVVEARATRDFTTLTRTPAQEQ